jgi:hypothetical protein
MCPWRRPFRWLLVSISIGVNTTANYTDLALIGQCHGENVGVFIEDDEGYCDLPMEMAQCKTSLETPVFLRNGIQCESSELPHGFRMFLQVTEPSVTLSASTFLAEVTQVMEYSLHILPHLLYDRVCSAVARFRSLAKSHMHEIPLDWQLKISII